MTEFGTPKMCMEGMQYRIKADQTTSETFTVETGLEQGNVQTPILLNQVLEKAVGDEKRNNGCRNKPAKNSNPKFC